MMMPYTHRGLRLDIVGALTFAGLAIGCDGNTEPLTPATVAATSPTTQDAEVGAAVSAPPAVKVTSTSGKPVPNVSVTFAVTEGGGSLSGAARTTDAAGVATAGGWTLGTVAGRNTVTATAGTLQPVVFTATGRAGPVSSVKVVPDNAQIEIGKTRQLVANLRDAYDNEATGRVVTWQSSNPAVATASADGVVTGTVNGSVTVTATSEGKTGTASIAVLGVNPSLVNGDFESGDPTFGWITGGTRNYSVSRVQSGTGHAAMVSVGNGPIGDASCTAAGHGNFAYLDQPFNTVKDRVVELDILVPVPSAEDATENATCPGWDRIEIDFVIAGSTIFETRVLGVVLIDYLPLATSAKYQGLINVHDNVAGTVSAAAFDPTAFAPVTHGAISLTHGATPGWMRASFDLSTSRFPWLPDNVIFRLTVRNEDNRFTGRHFAATVDNVRARPK